MKVKPLILLLLGCALIVLANLRWGLGILGWFAPVPFLHLLRNTRGWRIRLALFFALPAAWTLAVCKIITNHIPAVAALGYGIPIGIIFFLAFLAWDMLRKRRDDWRAVLAFPFIMVIAEWVQATFTPLGSWGSAAYTQLENLPVLQMASLFGIFGVSWVIYFTAAALEYAWAFPAGRRSWMTAAAVVAIAAHLFGYVRLSINPMADEKLIKVAAVGTDATFSGLPLPSNEEISTIEKGLFLRTKKAAEGGALLVVWNEGSTPVDCAHEAEFLQQTGKLASETQIDLVVAYIKPVHLEPLLYENKYVWFRPDGSVNHEYLKHEPVPGEPAKRGIAPMNVVNASFGKAGGAICYDYDFPRLAMRNTKLGVGIVALPSSDWLGIDPIHTQMATLRAIEGGYSIIRSTRMGLSAGIDPYGRIRGWLSSNESKDRILWVTLPAAQLETLYSKIHDLFVYVGIIFVLFVWIKTYRKNKQNTDKK